jgi:hypothetical protein
LRQVDSHDPVQPGEVRHDRDGGTDRHQAADHVDLVDAQLEVIEAQTRSLADARALLLTVKSRIDRGEPIDVATFCSLIRNVEKFMGTENWKKVTDRYYSPEEQARWAERMSALPAGFDMQDYNRRWQELGSRIEAALPLDPAGAEAQAFLGEWQALLEPFTSVATPEMMAGATTLYNRMDEWQGDQRPPFSMAVWRFIQETGEAGAG